MRPCGVVCGVGEFVIDRRRWVMPVVLIVLPLRVVGCVRGVVACWSVCSVIMWQVFKGARWMPWHQEPMKDAVICDKPRGADKRAVIRGSPNGGTPPRVMRGDPHLNS